MKMTDEDLRRIAKKRVEFRDHLIVYIIVNAFLFTINMLTVPQFWWFLFPLIFWGIGVAFHWREAYSGDEQTRVEREFQRMKARQRK